MISPDGRHIAFQSDRSADYELWVCDADGSNAVQLTHLGRAGSPHWSPDGRSIAFAGGLDPRMLFVIASSGGEPRRLTSENITAPSWSRDGRWIYFLSKGAAVDQVWKIALDGGKKIQVTKRGGGGGMESLDGKYFYYHKLADNALWRVPADGGEETLVTKERINYYNFWTLGTQGLYFTEPRPKEHKSILKLFRFETGQSTPLAVLDQPIPTAQYRLSVTADGRWLLYDQLDRDECDLMLIENFD
jgi:Tol biopolymer transport system component